MAANGIYVPVIVDVDSGFKEASSRVDAGMRDMEKEMSKHALSIKFDVEGVEGKKSIKTIMEDTTLSAEQLEGVLKQIEGRMLKMSQTGWKDATTGEMKEGLRDLMQAFNAVLNKSMGVKLIMESLIQTARGAAEENAKMAAENQKFLDTLKAQMEAEGEGTEAVLVRLKASMQKLKLTPMKLADGTDNPEFQKLLDNIHQMEKAVIQYQMVVNQGTEKERGRLEVLQQTAQTMSVLSQQLTAWRSILEKSEVGGDEFREAAESIQVLTEHLAEANDKFMQMSTNENSIKRISGEMASLNRQWAELGSVGKFDETGELSEKAETLITNYEALIALSEKYGETLADIAKKRADLKKHEEQLGAISTTMNGLQQSLAAWQQELNNADFGSKEWQNAAIQVEVLSEKIRDANEAARLFGLNNGSIDSINTKIQMLNKEWASLSKRFDDAGKMTDEAAKIYEKYKEATKELREQGQLLSDVLSKEEKAAKETADRAAKEREESEILKNEAKTIDQITAKIRLLTQKLNSTEIGSSEYHKLQEEVAGLNDKLKEATARVRDIKPAAESANVEFKKSNTLLGNLLKKTLYLFSIHTIARFLQNVREVTAEFELQRVALGSIIQDTERAEKLFRQIKTAAIESPFEIKDLVSYTKQLSAYQIETEKLFDTTMKLADVSAGLGVDMGRLILAYGQVRAAAVLRGQELRQFTEAGIPLVEKLAEKFRELGREGTTTADVFQLISERAVPFRMIEEIFDDMTSAGGMFYKMQEKQAKTLAGQWANLKDAVSIMYDEIGNTTEVHNAMESLISAARSMMQNWRMFANTIKVTGTSLLVFYGYQKAVNAAAALYNKIVVASTAAETAREKSLRKLITAVIGNTAAETIYRKALSLSAYATFKAEFATNKLTESFWRLTMAMLSNPFGIIAVALAGLITLFTTLSNKTRDVNQDIDTANKSIKALNDTRKGTKELIDQYEELSRKESLTAKEARKLKDVSEELARAFPKASEGIDENTKALKLNIDKLREYNREATDATIKGMQAQISIDKKEIEKNNKEIEKLSKQILAGWGANKFNKNQRLLSPIWLPLTEKQIAAMNAEISDLTDKNEQYTQSIKDMEDAIKGVENAAGSQTSQLQEWQNKLIQFNERQLEYNDTLYNIQVLSPDQIKNYSKLDAALEDLAKGYKDQEQTVQILTKAIEKKNGKERDELALALALAIARRDLTKEMLEYYDALWLTTKKGSGSEQTDPFITNMKDRIKFMKDFRKGYEDLSKYMSSDAAKFNEMEIMKGRGLSLGLDLKEQGRAAEDLAEWYRDQIRKVAGKLKEKGVKGASVSDILAIDTSKKSKYVRDLQALLQDLWEGLTDFRTDEVERKIKDSLKKLKEDLKQSEEARNFFQDIFDLTGDKDLAANMAISVYGDPGSELSDRIKESISRAMGAEGIKEDSELWAPIMGAAQKLDFRDVMTKFKDLPDGVRDAIEEAATLVQKYNKDTLTSYAKLLMKYNEVEQQRVNIENQANKDIADLREGLRLEIQGINENQAIQDKVAAEKMARDREEAAEKSVEREKELNLLRLTRDYRLFFESIGTISLESARKIARAEKKILYEQFEANEISLSKLRRELDRIDEQLKKYEDERNPFVTYLTKGLDGVFEKIKQAGMNLTALTGNLKDDKGNFSIPDGLEKAINVLGKIFGGGFFGIEGVAGRKNVFEQMKEQLGEDKEAWEKMAKNTEERLSAMATNMSQGLGWADFWVSFAGNGIKAFDQIAQRSKNVEGEVSDGWNKVAKFIMGSAASFSLGAPITGGILGQYIELDDAWERFTGLNEKAMSGFEKFKSGDIIGAIVDNVEGWMEVFDKNTKKIDREIKVQSDILEDLEYQYSRLDVAIQKSFGSDYIYNYNKQIEALRAEAEAYRKQAELEQSKGDKKRDQDKIDEYNKQARAVEDKIEDSRNQLSEFFSGTDLTSAAKDFAQSWIDAYKQFGNTTDAMKEKFEDMIQEMITNSLAADIMQRQLAPIFKMIDDLSQDDGILSAADIASIASRTNEIIPMINDSLSTLMAELTASGYNIRQQTGQFSGIARNIANASEESITGLAAGINTQNFYMQHIDATVTAILAAMTGGSVVTNEAVAGAATNPYQDEMLKNVAYLPQMSSDLANIFQILRQVTSDNPVKKVAVRM